MDYNMDFSQARANMVLSQINPAGVVTPAILRAFESVPRELFVPKTLRTSCYCDDDLVLPGGRLMPEPMVLAKMLEAAQPQDGESALIIGGTTGYGMALLATLGLHVTMLEQDHNFDDIRHAAFNELGLNPVTVRIGDFSKGPSDSSGYDVILVEGAVATSPVDLFAHLKPKGRLMTAIVPEGEPVGQMHLFEKSAQGVVAHRPLFDTYLPYLPGCKPAPRFVFN
jgi:protein-L-isoaspartate(D-aspartate) O-methyltransferase